MCGKSERKEIFGRKGLSGVILEDTLNDYMLCEQY
jgi:hypothetical protein